MGQAPSPAGANYRGYGGPRLDQYFPLAVIENHARKTLRLVADLSGGKISYPLEAERLVRELFQFDVFYDDGTIMDQIDPLLVGALYPEGMVCPATGSDRVIMVNDAPRFSRVTTSFTILHEVGHLLLHHPLDTTAGVAEAYCRTKEGHPTWSRVPPREWQAGRLAGEMLMPKELVTRVLDGIKPPEVVDLATYGPYFRKVFDVSQAAMEKRLADRSYSSVSGMYPFADVSETRGSV